MSLRLGEQIRGTRWRPNASLHRAAPTDCVDTDADRLRTRIDFVAGSIVFMGLLALFLGKAPGLGYFLSSRDHGSQLSIGTQVLLGKVPGIDLPIAYGPMVMYTSALGLWLSDSLIGETILCSLGYALSVFLIYHLVSRYSSKPVGLVAAGAGFALQARFYKWYVWLIPMAILWVWHRYLSSEPSRRPRWIALCGLVVGMCWLFRPDFGTTEMLACLVFLGSIEASEPPRSAARVMRALGLFPVGFSVFPLAWFVYLLARAGLEAPFTYLRLTIDATLAVSSGMATPLPPIRSVIAAYWLVPATYLFAFLAVGLRAREARLDERSWFLLAAALVGLASVHQAMHRMGPMHLLQVIPAAIVCAALMASWLLSGAPGWPLPVRAKPWIRVAGVGYAIVLVTIGLKLSRWGQCDLETFSPRPLARYRSLTRPLDQSDDPRVVALAAVAKLTDPRDPILVFPLDCQFYALTKRRISGRHSTYYPRVFASPKDCERNLEAIQSEMPKLVVVPVDFDKAPEETADLLVREALQSHQPIERFIRQHYPRIVASSGGVTVLSP